MPLRRPFVATIAVRVPVLRYCEMDMTMKRLAHIPADERANTEEIDLAIGWCAPIGRERLSEALLAFSCRHPQVAIGVQELPPAALVAGLRRGDLDLIVLPGRARAEFASRPLWCEPIGIALDPRHVLAARSELSATDLVQLRFIVSQRDRGAALHRLLAEHLGTFATQLQSVIHFGDDAHIETAIAEGVGAVLFCGTWPGQRDDTIALRPLRAPYGLIRLQAHWRADASSSETADLFAGMFLCAGPQDRP